LSSETVSVGYIDRSTDIPAAVRAAGPRAARAAFGGSARQAERPGQGGPGTIRTRYVKATRTTRGAPENWRHWRRFESLHNARLIGSVACRLTLGHGRYRLTIYSYAKLSN